jgi:hypothetical protein
MDPEVSEGQQRPGVPEAQEDSDWPHPVRGFKHVMPEYTTSPHRSMISESVPQTNINPTTTLVGAQLAVWLRVSLAALISTDSDLEDKDSAVK